MSESEDTRKIVANIFTDAAATAANVATYIPDPTVKAALGIGAAIAGIVGSLIGSIGAEQTKKLVEELQRRRNVGTISDKMLAEDDDYIRKTVSDLYKDKD